MSRFLAPLLAALAACSSLPELPVLPTADFDLDGSGRAPAWSAAPWAVLAPRKADGPAHETRAKLLYSKSGLYVLFDGADRRLSAKPQADSTPSRNSTRRASV